MQQHTQTRTRRSPARNGRPPALTREQVAAAALVVLDREGIDGLSMRRLASELGVGAMTLYGYFANKDELLEAVIDVASQAFVPPPPGGTFRTYALAHASAVREWLLAHPTLVALRGREAIVRPAAFAVSEPLFAQLLGLGLTEEDAARSFRVLFVYVFGSALFAGPEPTREERTRLEHALAQLPDDDFPALKAAAPFAGAALGGEAQFRFGLELILDGIEARAARGRRR